MGETLFRGKQTDNGEWIEGMLGYTNFNHGVEKSIMVKTKLGSIFTYSIKQETVGQYTGLTDKNGKKIFEGDICRVVYTDRMCDTDGKYHENEHEMFEEVVFEKGTFCFNVTIEDIAFYRPIGFDIYWKQKIKYFEVIGNIHDNAKLLEV